MLAVGRAGYWSGGIYVGRRGTRRNLFGVVNPMPQGDKGFLAGQLARPSWKVGLRPVGPGGMGAGARLKWFLCRRWWAAVEKEAAFLSRPEIYFGADQLIFEGRLGEAGRASRRKPTI